MTRRDNRKHDRGSLFLVAAVRHAPDGASYPVKLRNISTSGVMAEGPVRFVENDPLWVDLRNVGWIAGRVAWTVGNRCGIAFDTPIAAEKVQFPVAEVDLPKPSTPAGRDIPGRR